MFGYLLAALAPLILVFVVQANRGRTPARVIQLLFVGYFIRLVLQAFMRDLPFFSYGAGGDWIWYEERAKVIWQFWEHGIYKYITQEDFPAVGPTSLPPNLFGFIYFLNGGPTRVGCCAVVALVACLSCLDLYYLAIELGAQQKTTVRLFAVQLFGPAFLLYTSDVYKDGIVLFFVVTIVTTALRLTRKITAGRIILGLAAVFGLYLTRFYMIFVALAPLGIGLVGIGGKNVRRQLMVALALSLGLAIIATQTGLFKEMGATADTAWNAGTSNRAIASGAVGGSGVTFDDGGSALGALHLKILYTLFAPFPWMGGSLALQLSKIEVMVWYYVIYRCGIAIKRLWREDRSLLLSIMSFLLPATVMYSFVMANVGLIVRERLSIVAIGYMLGALSWKRAESRAPVRVAETRMSPRERLLARARANRATREVRRAPTLPLGKPTT